MKRQKEWYFENKEKISEYRAAHREDQKEYRSENKEKFSEYQKKDIELKIKGRYWNNRRNGILKIKRRYWNKRRNIELKIKRSCQNIRRNIELEIKRKSQQKELKRSHVNVGVQSQKIK